MKKLIIFLGMLLSSTAYCSGVLFIGDSHIPGPFGLRLDELLRQDHKFAVETYGVCAAIATSFLSPYQTKCGYFFHGETTAPSTGTIGPAPNAETLLKKMKPELTLIELGSNYVTYQDGAIVADMKKLVDAVIASGSKCVWISMPDTRKFRSEQPRILADTLQAIHQNCKFIDSTALTHYPDQGGDGLHYQTSADFKPIAVNWANAVYSQIQSLIQAL